MRKYLFILTAIFKTLAAFAQSEGAVEQYHYIGANQPYLYMPVVHFQSSRQWYTEARYNYEDVNTLSLYFGKTFSRDNKVAYSFTPLLGGAIGKFNGISTGLNMDLEYKKFFFSAQSQYSFSTDKNNIDFLYNWSELGYEATRWLYAGVSFQQTYTAGERVLEPAVLAGFSYKRYTIPVYAFDLFNKERYFIVGLTISWNSGGKPVKTPLPSLVTGGN